MGDLAREQKCAHRRRSRAQLERERGAQASWLRGMRWAYVATGTFARPMTAWGILEVVRKWLDSLEGAYAAIGLQYGPVAAKLHVHALIGGVRRVPLTETFLRRSWVKGGHVQLDGYHPARGFVEYLVTQADAIELIGSPRPYRTRRRGGRR